MLHRLTLPSTRILSLWTAEIGAVYTPEQSYILRVISEHLLHCWFECSTARVADP